MSSYSAQGYTASYPAPWTIARDDVDKGTYRDTKFVAPNGQDFVLIDHSSSVTADPQSSAKQVRADVQHGRSGYQEVAFGPTSIGGVAAWKWTFDQTTSGRRERRTDFFFNLGNDGFAVLGGGRTGSVLPVAADVARSIRLKSGSSSQQTSGTHGGSGQISKWGEVGKLSFDASSENDIRSFAGDPDATSQGSFEVPNTPSYRALGYDCSSQQGVGLQSMTYNPSGQFCRTIYYINSSTNKLEAFFTGSSNFATLQGTKPGTTQQDAESREAQKSVAGCHNGISYGYNTDPATVNIDIGSQGPGAGTVVDLAVESNSNGVGLEFC